MNLFSYRPRGWLICLKTDVKRGQIAFRHLYADMAVTKIPGPTQDSLSLRGSVVPVVANSLRQVRLHGRQAHS